MISANSRYAQSKVVVDTDLDNQDVQVIVPSIQSSYTFNFSFYFVRDVDTMSTMAFDFLGDPTLWWMIADANPEILLWDEMPVGQFIRIPVGGGF